MFLLHIYVATIQVMDFVPGLGLEFVSILLKVTSLDQVTSRTVTRQGWDCYIYLLIFKFRICLSLVEPQVEEEITEEPKKEEPKKEDIVSIFKSATKLLKDWSKKIGRKDWSSVGSEEVNKVLDKMKTLSKNILPENAAEQVQWGSVKRMYAENGCQGQ